MNYLEVFTKLLKIDKLKMAPSQFMQSSFIQNKYLGLKQPSFMRNSGIIFLHLAPTVHSLNRRAYSRKNGLFEKFTNLFSCL